MTPKEKAGDLIDKFRQNQFSGCIICSDSYEDKDINAKSLALIAVDETLNLLETLHKPEYCSFYSKNEDVKDGYEVIAYWQEVRTEIEQL